MSALMSSAVQYPRCALLLEKEKQQMMKKRCPLFLKSPQICFWLVIALTSKYKPDISPSLWFSALRGLFDFPEGKTCQKRSNFSSFLYFCHASITALLEPSFLCSESRLIDGSFIYPVVTSNLDVLIYPLTYSKIWLLKKRHVFVFAVCSLSD